MPGQQEWSQESSAKWCTSHSDTTRASRRAVAKAGAVVEVWGRALANNQSVNSRQTCTCRTFFLFSSAPETLKSLATLRKGKTSVDTSGSSWSLTGQLCWMLEGGILTWWKIQLLPWTLEFYELIYCLSLSLVGESFVLKQQEKVRSGHKGCC